MFAHFYTVLYITVELGSVFNEGQSLPSASVTLLVPNLFTPSNYGYYLCHWLHMSTIL